MDTLDLATPEQHSRRTFLEWGARITGGTLAAMALSSCGSLPGMSGSAEPAPQTGPEQAPTGGNTDGAETMVTGYIPDDLSAEAYQALTPMLSDGTSVNQVNVAFALPNENGEVTPPQYAPGLLELLGQTSLKTEVMMSVAGYSIDGSHDIMQDHLKAAFENPTAFIESVLASHADFVQTTGLTAERVGIDLDIEYPTAEQTETLTMIIQEIRRRLPDSRLTMAIPVSEDQAFYDLTALAPFVDTFNVMTYDYNGPGWSMMTGDIAPADQVIADIDTVIAKVGGDASKIAVGFPAYGYRYKDARRRGSTFTSTEEKSSIALSDIPQDKITAPGEAVIDGDWISFVAPAQVASTMATLRAKYPKLAGSFVWKLNGTTPEFLAAMHG